MVCASRALPTASSRTSASIPAVDDVASLDRPSRTCQISRTASAMSTRRRTHGGVSARAHAAHSDAGSDVSSRSHGVASGTCGAERTPTATSHTMVHRKPDESSTRPSHGMRWAWACIARFARPTVWRRKSPPVERTSARPRHSRRRSPFAIWAPRMPTSTAHTHKYAASSRYADSGPIEPQGTEDPFPLASAQKIGRMPGMSSARMNPSGPRVEMIARIAAAYASKTAVASPAPRMARTCFPRTDRSFFAAALATSRMGPNGLTPTCPDSAHHTRRASASWTANASYGAA